MDLFDFDVETNPAIHSDMDPDPASKNYVPLCSVQKNLALVFEKIVPYLAQKIIRYSDETGFDRNFGVG